MQAFIRAHRAELDAAIDARLYVGGATPSRRPSRNDEDRRQWVLNDEALYLWARREGVRV